MRLFWSVYSWESVYKHKCTIHYVYTMINSGVGIEYVLALEYFSEHGVQSAKHTRREARISVQVLYYSTQ